MNWNVLSVVRIIKEIALLKDVSDANGFDPTEALGEKEVWQGLLLERINLHQDDILRRHVAQNRLAQEPVVSLDPQAPEEKF